MIRRLLHSRSLNNRFPIRQLERIRMPRGIVLVHPVHIPSEEAVMGMIPPAGGFAPSSGKSRIPRPFSFPLLLECEAAELATMADSLGLGQGPEGRVIVECNESRDLLHPPIRFVTRDGSRFVRIIEIHGDPWWTHP